MSATELKAGTLPRPDGRRVLAVGRTKGRSPLIQVTARSGDFAASARMEAARRERTREGERP